MKIVLGSDHAGFELKNAIAAFVQELGHETVDVGAYSSDSCDYPEYAHKAAETVLAGDADRAVLVCGTGIGIGIAANKVDGFRCGTCSNEIMARLSRRHNDAQGVAVGSRIVGTELAFSIVRAFLEEEFEGGRHQRRVDGMEHDSH